MANQDNDANLLERLVRLEKIAGIGHNGGPALGNPPPPSDPDLEAQDRRLSTAMVAARYGIVVRTVERWLVDYPNLNFPQPDVVNGRRYWWLSVLREWDRDRIRQVRRGTPKQNAPKSRD